MALPSRYKGFLESLAKLRKRCSTKAIQISLLLFLLYQAWYEHQGGREKKFGFTYVGVCIGLVFGEYYFQLWTPSNVQNKYMCWSAVLACSRPHQCLTTGFITLQWRPAVTLNALGGPRLNLNFRDGQCYCTQSHFLAGLRIKPGSGYGDQWCEKQVWT